VSIATFLLILFYAHVVLFSYTEQISILCAGLYFDNANMVSRLFRLDIGGSSLPGEWWGSGTGCPGRFWMPRIWRCSGLGWMGPWAAWSIIRYEGCWPCLWQGGWSLMILEVPCNPRHPMILWFCDFVILWFYDSMSGCFFDQTGCRSAMYITLKASVTEHHISCSFENHNSMEKAGGVNVNNSSLSKCLRNVVYRWIVTLQMCSYF